MFRYFTFFTVRVRDQFLIDNLEEEVARLICVTFLAFHEEHSVQYLCVQAVCYLLTDNGKSWGLPPLLKLQSCLMTL